MTAKILIVEDEIIVAMSMQLHLRQLGYEPIGIAPDLDNAFRLAERAPDLALVDLNLRDGLTGPEIGTQLSRKHGVAVLFVTANPRVLGQGIAGTIGVLTKPTDRDAIKQAVDYALRVRRGELAEPPLALKTFASAR
jgi:two-component system, response regulator PdtaR